jgi:hypothetical protein
MPVAAEPNCGLWHSAATSKRHTNHQQLMIEADLGGIEDQPHLASRAGLAEQPAVGNRPIQLAHAQRSVIEHTFQTAGDTALFRLCRDLAGDQRQLDRLGLQHATHQRGESAQTGDAFVWAQLPQLLQAGMIHTVDRHLSPPCTELWCANQHCTQEGCVDQPFHRSLPSPALTSLRNCRVARPRTSDQAEPIP